MADFPYTTDLGGTKKASKVTGRVRAEETEKSAKGLQICAQLAVRLIKVIRNWIVLLIANGKVSMYQAKGHIVQASNPLIQLAVITTG